MASVTVLAVGSPAASAPPDRQRRSQTAALLPWRNRLLPARSVVDRVRWSREGRRRAVEVVHRVAGLSAEHRQPRIGPEYRLGRQLPVDRVHRVGVVRGRDRVGVQPGVGDVGGELRLGDVGGQPGIRDVGGQLRRTDAGRVPRGRRSPAVRWCRRPPSALSPRWWRAPCSPAVTSTPEPRPDVPRHEAARASQTLDRLATLNPSLVTLALLRDTHRLTRTLVRRVAAPEVCPITSM